MKPTPLFERFVAELREVERKIRYGYSKPWSDDLVIAGYDLNPRQGCPSNSTLLKCLEELALFRPIGMDKGAFVYNCIVELGARIRADEEETERLVSAYATYRRLQDGRVTKCKLRV